MVPEYFDLPPIAQVNLKVIMRFSMKENIFMEPAHVWKAI